MGKSNLGIQIWAYIDIFETLVWFTITGLIITISLAYTMICCSKINESSEEYSCFTVFALTTIFPLNLILGSGIVTKSASAKMISLSTGLMTCILWCHFSSDLMARMTSAPQTTTGIRSFQDVIDGNFNVVVMEFSANHEFLQDADPTSAKYKYYHNNMNGNPDAFVTSTKQGKTAMLNRENTLYYGTTFNVIGDDMFKALKMTDATYSTFGWAFRKKSELTDFFSYHLHQLKQTGLLDKFDKKWIYEECNSPFLAVKILLDFIHLSDKLVNLKNNFL
jgi:hypothetical protein